MAWNKASFARPATKTKTVAKKVSSRKPSGRPSSTKTTYKKSVPSTTNYGTRPSVMPGQPGVPTGGTKIVNKGASLVSPVPIGKAALLGPAARVSAIAQAATAAKKTAGNLGTPVKSAYVKTPPPTSRTHFNHPTETSVPVNRGGAPTGGRPNTPVGPRTTTPVTPTAPAPPPVAPPPVAPPVRPPVVGNTNPTPRFTSLTGRNVTAGRFNRNRLGRGPLANESLTPEELRRIAAQKVNNYG